MIAAAHLGLALVKLNAKLGYLPLVLKDPSGVKSFLAVSVMQTMPAPVVLIGLDLLKWLVVAVLLIGFALSVRAAQTVCCSVAGSQTDRNRPLLLASLINLIVLSAFYGATVYEWLFVR